MAREEISRRISELGRELESARGSRTEVYARIVGYYRSVRNWNPGKREEFSRRARYGLPSALSDATENAGERAREEVRGGNVACREDDASKKGPFAAEDSGTWLLFTRKACPNCPPVKAMLAQSGIEGVEIDVDAGEGLNKAREWGVMSAPTAIFLDREGKERGRARSAQELRALATGTTR